MIFFKPCAILSKYSFTNEENQEITSFFETIQTNQNKQIAFFEYCKKWKIAPWIFVQMQRYEFLFFLDKNVQNNFSNFYKKIKIQNENRNNEALHFSDKFKNTGIDVIILKGNLFIHSIYNDVGYKKMNDFDMLIQPKDWKKVQEIYEHLNYIPLGFGWTGEKQEPAKFSHAGMSFISANYQCITGTQWGLKSPTSKYKLNIQKIWNATKVFDFYGLRLKQLSPEYNILHLILHIGIYKIGIRDCMDIYNIFITQTIDKELLYQIIIESNAIDKAYFAFKLCNLCAHVLDENYIERFKPKKETFITKRLQSRLKMAKKTGDFQLSYNDYFHEIENNVFYFNLFPYFHKKIYFYARIVKYIFLPKKELAFKLIDFSGKPTFLKYLEARWKAPRYGFQLIGEEIGLSITFLLFFKLFFDTFLSLKNYIFIKESYFDYLKKRNINVENIKQAVKEIE